MKKIITSTQKYVLCIEVNIVELKSMSGSMLRLYGTALISISSGCINPDKRVQRTRIIAGMMAGFIRFFVRGMDDKFIAQTNRLPSRKPGRN